MQIVRDVAGYSIGRSDLVRRAMAKKKHDVMMKEKEYFIHGLEENGVVTVPGAVRLGVPEEVAEHLFDEMTAFASYAFNKAHAACYAVVGVQTGWLKVHYPERFFAALMNSVTGNMEKVAYYIQYCRRRGMQVLRPDIQYSREGFWVDGAVRAPGRDGREYDAIRFGMDAVKSVGRNAVRAIIAERERGGLYRDLHDFIRRMPDGAINKKAVESLVLAGALDSLPGSRAQKMAVYEQAMDSAAKTRKANIEGQLSLFGFGGGDTVMPEPEGRGFPDISEFPLRTMLNYEKEMTGVYISGHPLDEYSAELSQLEVNSRFLVSLSEEEDKGLNNDGQYVRMGGLITEKRSKPTKSGGLMGFITLEDLYGSTEALIFPKVFQRVQSLLDTEEPVVVTGRLSVREEESPKLLLDSVEPLLHGMDLSAAPRPQYRGRRDSREGAPLPPPDLGETPPVTAFMDTVPAKTLYLRLSDESKMPQTGAILSLTPGPIRVVLRLVKEQKTLAAPREWYVSERVRLQALTELLGEGSVIMK